MSEITNKLINIQTELKAPKGQYNSFSKFKYRSGEDTLEAVKPLNAEQGLLLTLTDKPILVGDRYYIQATAGLTDGKDVISTFGYARESAVKKGMDDSQITGTASSYARKYALNGLYLIDDTKDSDTDEYTKQVNKGEKDAANENKQVNKGVVKAKFIQLGGTAEQFDPWYEKQASAGQTNNTMDSYLTKQLADKK